MDEILVVALDRLDDGCPPVEHHVHDVGALARVDAPPVAAMERAVSPAHRLGGAVRPGGVPEREIEVAHRRSRMAGWISRIVPCMRMRSSPVSASVRSSN